MPTNGIFRDYERDAITRVCTGVLSSDILEAVLAEAELVELHHTGAGYMLTVRHDSLPEERIIGNAAMGLGEAGDVRVGFVVFIENGELTLDGHNMGAADGVPHDVRDLPLVIRNVPSGSQFPKPIS